MMIKILSSASVLPGRTITNEELAVSLKTDAETLLKSSGISQRRYIVSGDTGCGLLAEATKNACAQIGIEPKDLQAFFASTLTPDHQFPGNSSFLQKELAVAGPATLDIRSCDGGFLHTLQAAMSLIETGLFSRVLLTANEIFSTYLRFSPDGAGETELFGDGAAVWIIGPSDSETGFLAVETGNDPKNVRSFWAQKPGTFLHPRMNRALVESDDWHFKLDQESFRKETYRLLPSIAHRAMQKANVKTQDIRLFIPGVLKSAWASELANEIGIPTDLVAIPQISRGYYGTAMIPETLDLAWRNGLVKKGDLVLAAAVGSGISFGAMVYRV